MDKYNWGGEGMVDAENGNFVEASIAEELVEELEERIGELETENEELSDQITEKDETIDSMKRIVGEFINNWESEY
jgi:chaperonin cofactor prefoldin